MGVEGTFSVTIAAAPEAVWPWISQLDRHAQWSPKPYRVELVAGEPGAVGSRYRSVGAVPGDKDHANEVEIVEVLPPMRFALRADDENGSFDNTYDLRAQGDGTEVTWHLAFPPMKGVAKVLAPVLFPIVGKADARKRMQLLKERVEGTSGSA